MQKQTPSLAKVMTMVLFALSCFGLLLFLWVSFGVPTPLKPASENLANATPDLTRSFKVLNSLFNLIGYNENGRQGPEVPGRDEGFLFWIAWLDHNAASLFATGDANGPFRPVTLGAPCSVLKQLGDENPQLGMVFSPALLDPKICGAK